MSLTLLRRDSISAKSTTKSARCSLMRLVSAASSENLMRSSDSSSSRSASSLLRRSISAFRMRF